MNTKDIDLVNTCFSLNYSITACVNKIIYTVQEECEGSFQLHSKEYGCRWVEPDQVDYFQIKSFGNRKTDKEQTQTQT